MASASLSPSAHQSNPDLRTKPLRIRTSPTADRPPSRRSLLTKPRLLLPQKEKPQPNRTRLLLRPTLRLRSRMGLRALVGRSGLLLDLFRPKRARTGLLRAATRCLSTTCSTGTSARTLCCCATSTCFGTYLARSDTQILTAMLCSATDFQLVLVLSYAATLTLFPTGSLTLHFLHALTWCLFHSCGLGLLLRAQSQSKFLVRHYLKHYHYPQHDRGQGAVHEAFQNWKTIYNLSMCMTYGGCIS